MRLGGPIPRQSGSPEEWVLQVQTLGYRAAYCPIGLDAPADEVRRFAAAARKADIVIAEVGAWSNPLSPDPNIAAAAIEKCKRSLELAERIGARCCVNIAGSRGPKWDGPHPDDLTAETFGRVVAVVQEIVDSVRPAQTSYTLETMPWMVPDSVDSYQSLIAAIDRPAFAVHLDPVNLICSPQRYFANSALLRECFANLGPLIKSCHAKDIILRDRLTVHLDEVRPGEGALDYRTYLSELAKLPDDTPLMLEHLSNAQEYTLAAEYVRSIAQEIGVGL